MIRIAIAAPLIGAFALFFSAPVPGQPQGEKPAAVSAAPQMEQSKPAVRKVRRSRKDVDARHCLQLATNIEIHRCSLKYR